MLDFMDKTIRDVGARKGMTLVDIFVSNYP